MEEAAGSKKNSFTLMNEEAEKAAPDVAELFFFPICREKEALYGTPMQEVYFLEYL